MPLPARLRELRLAVGTPRAIARKLRNAAGTGWRLLNVREHDRRIERLQDRGLVGERPTAWQLWLGASHMMFRFILPSNQEFYASYDQGHWWQQVLRVLDEPSAVMDPIGLAIDQRMLVSHLVQVVHSSAGYDVALLQMFDDGLASLRVELERLVAGTHPRQEAIDAIVERDDYHRALLNALDRFEADPVTFWRVDTLPAPEGCGPLFDWGVETFGSPGRLFAYSRALPETPWASVRAWLTRERRPRPAGSLGRT